MRAAAAAALAVLALASAGCGSGDGRASSARAPTRRTASSSSREKCAACHTLAEAKATGKIGPNLDASFASDRAQGFEESTFRQVVADQIKFPGDYGENGPTMPKDLVDGRGRRRRRRVRRVRRRQPEELRDGLGAAGDDDPAATSGGRRRRSGHRRGQEGVHGQRLQLVPHARRRRGDREGRAGPRQAEDLRCRREQAARGLHPRVDRRTRTTTSRRATRRASCPSFASLPQEHARRPRGVPRRVREVAELSSQPSRTTRRPVSRGSLPNRYVPVSSARPPRHAAGEGLARAAVHARARRGGSCAPSSGRRP